MDSETKPEKMNKAKKNKAKKNKDNINRNIYVSKLTLNIGTGKDQALLEKGLKLLQSLTGRTPVKCLTNKRIAGWGLRPGLPIGCKVTLRRQAAAALIPRLLDSKEFLLSLSNFDNAGNISFGIPEYIDIKDAKYDPEIGIIGLQASITLARPGFRIKLRKLAQRKIPKNHRITKEEAVEFMKTNFSLKITEEEEGEE